MMPFSTFKLIFNWHTKHKNVHMNECYIWCAMLNCLNKRAFSNSQYFMFFFSAYFAFFFLLICFVLLFPEAESLVSQAYCIAKDDLDLLIFLCQLAKMLDYRHGHCVQFWGSGDQTQGLKLSASWATSRPNDPFILGHPCVCLLMAGLREVPSPAFTVFFDAPEGQLVTNTVGKAFSVWNTFAISWHRFPLYFDIPNVLNIASNYVT